jgi:hypothetical protein
MSDLFSVTQSDLFTVEAGAELLWSPEGKILPKQCDDPTNLKFSPPTSKECFQKLRTKYQSALSTMNVNVQMKSTKTRRRQSFAISQMLQSVTSIASTPLKMTSADAERLVESMRKSTVKRKSMAPKSAKKTRAQVLRRVSRNIDEIFASHFAEAEADQVLTQATPHYNKQVKRSKEIQLVDRFDDDPFESLMGGSPVQCSSTPPKGPSTPPTSGRKSAAKASTPQSARKQIASPGPRTPHYVVSNPASARKSTLGSAVRLRDQNFNTSPQMMSPKPAVPLSQSRRPLLSARKAPTPLLPKSAQKAPASNIATPTRPAASPAGRTPAYYTAPGTNRLAQLPPASSTPQRKTSMSVASVGKAYQIAASHSMLQAAQAPQVNLSVEKMGAILQSMKKNDAKNRNAALSVIKARGCTPQGNTTAKKAPSSHSVVKTLPFSDYDCTPAVETPMFMYADQDAMSCEDSLIMDAVLGLDLDMAAFADADDEMETEVDSPSVFEEEGSAMCVVEDEPACDPEEGAGDLSAPASVVLGGELLEASVFEDMASETEASSTVIPSDSVIVLKIHDSSVASDARGESAATAEEDVMPSGYASDSSTSPQNVRVRYSVGSTARRSLSNTRGRISIGALDGVGLAGDRAETSPIVFHAPVCKAAVFYAPPSRGTTPAAKPASSKSMATPRSLSKNAVRLAQSAVKVLLSSPKATASAASASSAKKAPAAPQGSSTDMSDSDLDTSSSSLLQQSADKIIRAAAQPSRRKSLGNVSVTNLIKKFQANVKSPVRKEKKAAPVGESAAATIAASADVPVAVQETAPEQQVTPLKILAAEIAKSTGRVTRSAAKGATSTKKTSATPMLSPRTAVPATASPVPRATPAAPASVSVEGGKAATAQKTPFTSLPEVDECASLRRASQEILSTLGSETPATPVLQSSTKRARASTAKKVASAVKAAPVPVEAAALEASEEIDANNENAPVSVVNVQKTEPVVLASALKTAGRRKTIATGARSVAIDAAVASPTPTYSLRSRKSLAAPPASTPAPADTARELFAEAAARTPAHKSYSTRQANKTPAGTYTAAKAKRTERNKKLDALVGDVDELLSMIEATVS